MGKLTRAGILFAAIGAIMYAGGFTAIAPAQVKDKDKTDKKDKKDAKAKLDDIGVMEVFKAKDGWRFRVKNADGKSIAIGTVPFETMAEARRSAEEAKAIVSKSEIKVIEEKK
jgi:hypothetical protein